MLRIVLALATLLFAGAAAAEPPAIAAWTAFVRLADASGELRRIEGARFPLIPGGACFGWTLITEGVVRDIVSVKEEYTTPATPTHWGIDPTYTTLSEDRHTATSVFEFPPLLGRMFSNSWCVTAGDPPGPYIFKVYLNGDFVRKFCLEGVPPEGFRPIKSATQDGCPDLNSMAPGGGVPAG